ISSSVDYDRLWYGRDRELLCDGPVDVEKNVKLQAEAFHAILDRRAILLHVDGEEGYVLARKLFGRLVDDWQGLQTRPAPARPKIKDDYFSAMIGEVKLPAVHSRQRKVGSGLAV